MYILLPIPITRQAREWDSQARSATDIIYWHTYADVCCRMLTGFTSDSFIHIYIHSHIYMHQYTSHNAAGRGAYAPNICLFSLFAVHKLVPNAQAPSFFFCMRCIFFCKRCTTQAPPKCTSSFQWRNNAPYAHHMYSPFFR
jgi:hypothetical protein